MDDEIFEIYDMQGNLIGRDIRANAHALGLWHAVVHVWLYEQIDDQLWIYMQQRAFTKKDFAGLYDITTAGHVDVQETKECAALRECQEEIGIPLESIHYIGDVKEAVFQKKITDKEIAHVFIAPVQCPSFHIGEEVETIGKVKGEDFHRYIQNRSLGLKLYSLDTNTRIHLQDSQLCYHASIYYEWILDNILHARTS